MDNLVYHNFIEIARNLSSPDILSLCSTNREYNGFCKRPSFWSDLISLKYNLRVPQATYKDFRFIDELENVKITLPQRGALEGSQMTYDAVIDLAEQYLNSYKSIELNAYQQGNPIRYFMYPPERLSRFGIQIDQDLNGVWFMAYTPEGALLKCKDYVIDPVYGDYLVYRALNPYVYQHILGVATLGSYNYSRDDVLFETKRPYLDRNFDGSRLTKSYEKALKVAKQYEIPDRFFAGPDQRIKAKAQKAFALAELDRYYKTELNALRIVSTRYFIVPPEILYKTNGDFDALAGIVIVAGSPEGALLRLMELVPKFVEIFVGYIPDRNSYVHPSMYTPTINAFVLTADDIYLSSGHLNYLVEINQPRLM